MRITLASVVLSVCLVSVSQGAFRTVSNTPNFPAQYATLQAALDACVHGDVVLVAGSETTYGSVTVKKRVTIIGPGYNPNKQSALAAKITTLTLPAPSVQLDSSGTLLLGLDITEIQGVVSGAQAYQRIQDVVIERCRVGTIQPQFAKNWTVKNCIVTGYFQGGSPTNQCDGLLISNNIVSGQFYSYNTSDMNTTVANNLFIRATGTIYYSPTYVRNILFTNNIFYGAAPYSATNEFCTWNNNISSYTTNNAFNVTGTNSGGSNFADTDPDFVGVVKQAVAFNYNQSFHTNAGSPAIGAGTDGKDIGIYGGMFPWPDGGAVPWETSPMPYIPLMEALNIQNANIPENGALNVNIKARTND